MKTPFDKILRKSLLVLLILLVGFSLLYQYRFFIAGAIWQARHITDYMIAVQTLEEFGSDNRVVTACHYILAVQNEEIEIGDISCENNTKQRLTYRGREMTAPGLIHLAKELQPFFKIADRNFYASIDWRYGFPSKLIYRKSDESYRVVITVEDFKLYK